MKNLIALLLAMMMVFALCACGDSSDAAEDAAAASAATEADAAVPATEAEEASAASAADAAADEGGASGEMGDASGEMGGASGEMASGETIEAIEAVIPDDSYSKDFEGYRAYAIDAFAADDHVPDEVREEMAAGLEAAEDENDSTIAMLIDAGLILSYADFLES